MINGNCVWLIALPITRQFENTVNSNRDVHSLELSRKLIIFEILKPINLFGFNCPNLLANSNEHLKMVPKTSVIQIQSLEFSINEEIIFTYSVDDSSEIK
jgi:hypothetical protein